MKKGRIIQFCYRKIIDNASEKQWEKYVFESSYKEFRMQAQLYNQDKKFRTIAEILHHVPAAERLHFLVSPSITGYIQQLKGIVPDVLDNLGKHFLHFEKYRFEIINSDIQDISHHQVAINFFSEPVEWIETIGNYMLITRSHEKADEENRLTHLVELKPFFSIYSLKEEV
ncbi:MAG TPA: hypothetical protein PLU37_01940 [Chitinophagaceae bacterium]|nr:hypothetical protein [Chitinophagaceae bacterium]MCB9054637.1 hypothetical protein [Chitinophagales bacterium]HPG10261.1 hypothetical protein [Chitinophagaceae bacterium]HRX92922.1 hypothetical protein [Chitinophagaceae bacterium]